MVNNYVDPDQMQEQFNNNENEYISKETVQQQFDKAKIGGYGMRNPDFDTELPGMKKNQYTDLLKQGEQEDISFKNDSTAQGYQSEEK